jgi:hypothetical protein
MGECGPATTGEEFVEILVKIGFLTEPDRRRGSRGWCRIACGTP